MNLNSQSGFTLVELLGVVAIVAILAMIAIQGIGGAIDAARESAARRQVQVLNSAYQSYIAAGGTPSEGATTVDEVVQALLQPMIQIGLPPIGPFITAASVDAVYEPMIPLNGTRVLAFHSSVGFSLEDVD